LTCGDDEEPGSRHTGFDQHLTSLHAPRATIRCDPRDLGSVSIGTILSARAFADGIIGVLSVIVLSVPLSFPAEYFSAHVSIDCDARDLNHPQVLVNFHLGEDLLRFPNAGRPM